MKILQKTTVYQITVKRTFRVILLRYMRVILFYGIRCYKERKTVHVISSKILGSRFLISVCYKTLSDPEELKVHDSLTGWNLS